MDWSPIQGRPCSRWMKKKKKWSIRSSEFIVIIIIINKNKVNWRIKQTLWVSQGFCWMLNGLWQRGFWLVGRAVRCRIMKPDPHVTVHSLHSLHSFHSHAPASSSSSSSSSSLSNTWLSAFIPASGNKPTISTNYLRYWHLEVGQPAPITAKTLSGVCRVGVRNQCVSAAEYTELEVKVKELILRIKSEDSEALDGGTSQLSSQREYGEIKTFWGGF